MNPSPRPAVFIHDARRIISANEAAMELFHCEAWELIDRELLEFVPDALKDLTKFNLYTTKQGKGTMLKSRRYDFLRCDGSVFAADVVSWPLDDGHIETTVTYRYEVR
jgi:PAS domain S-box-containing protein